jgi:hypothetical protein
VNNSALDGGGLRLQHGRPREACRGCFLDRYQPTQPCDTCPLYSRRVLDEQSGFHEIKFEFGKLAMFFGDCHYDLIRLPGSFRSLRLLPLFDLLFDEVAETISERLSIGVSGPLSLSVPVANGYLKARPYPSYEACARQGANRILGRCKINFLLAAVRLAGVAE